MSNGIKEPRNSTADPRWQLAIRRFFAKPSVEILVGVLVVISVVFTLMELWLDSSLRMGLEPELQFFGPLTELHLHWMETLNFLITCIFVLELTARYLGASRKTDFLLNFGWTLSQPFPYFASSEAFGRCDCFGWCD